MPLLILLFIAVPLLELLVIIEVARGLGVGPTLALLLATAIAGAILLRSQGRAAWRRFNLALSEGRVPARETFDGAMIIFGGALLLTPGFLTDLTGLALLAPPTRSLLRRGLTGMAGRRIALTWRVARMPWSRRRKPDAPPPRAPGGPGGGAGFDYEGTAREVDGGERELPRTERDA